MRIFRHPSPLPTELRGAVLAVGNFDGVHLGHRVVIDAARDVASRIHAPHGVVTFEPHPRSFFRPNDPPFRLTPFRSKMHALEAGGADLAVSLHFDSNQAMQGAREFVRDILIGALGAAHIVIGYDFIFGHERQGNAELLTEMGRELGFGLTIVPAARYGATDVAISSTEIRRRLVAGDPAGAAALLGRPWEIEGRVEYGDRRGRTIGFPTANLPMADYLRPATGVYAVRNGVEATDGTLRWVDGVANIGVRPTVDGTDLRLESHLFDFAEDIYGRSLRVQLVHRLREERKFSGLDELKAQIARDAEDARARLRVTGQD